MAGLARFGISRPCCNTDICGYGPDDWPAEIDFAFNVSSTATTSTHTPSIGPCSFRPDGGNREQVVDSDQDYVTGGDTDYLTLKLKEDATYRIQVDSSTFTYDLGTNGVYGSIEANYHAFRPTGTPLVSFLNYDLQQWDNNRSYVITSTTDCTETEANDSGMTVHPGSVKTSGADVTTLETEPAFNFTVVRNGDTHTITPTTGSPITITGSCAFYLQLRVSISATARTNNEVNHGDGRNLSTTATGTLTGNINIAEV